MGKVSGLAVKEKSHGPMIERDRAQVALASGLEGDFRGRMKRRQITILSAEVWTAVMAGLGANLPWTARRANLLVSGLDLPRQAGVCLRVGETLLEVTEETAPCSRMEKTLAGLQAALKPDWNGGVCCKVIEGGEITVGDEVSLV